MREELDAKGLAVALPQLPSLSQLLTPHDEILLHYLVVIRRHANVREGLPKRGPQRPRLDLASP